MNRLSGIAPDAVEDFKAGTAAIDAEKYNEAIEFFKKVTNAAPDFDAGHRRLGSALAQSGAFEEGLVEIRKALGLADSAANRESYAYALWMRQVNSDDGYPSGRADTLRAIKDAIELEDDPKSRERLLFMAGLQELENGSLKEMLSTATIIESEFPKSPYSHYFKAIDNLEKSKISSAKEEINEAVKLGMSEEDVAHLRAAVSEYENSWPVFLMKIAGWLIIILFVWAAGILGIYLYGNNLSSKTLRLLKDSDPNDIHGESQAGIRSSYRFLIKLASMYYYISQPFLILLIVSSVALFLYISVVVGRFFIYAIIAFTLAAAYTIWTLITTHLSAKVVEESGRPLARESAPRLYDLTDQVAEALNTRGIDEIRLTSGTDIAVYERGTRREKANDRAQRIMLLGVAVFEGFELNAFRSILAHEYGHFSNRDTAGGDIAYRVQRDILAFAEELGMNGYATWYNIGFHFIKMYYSIFTKITLGATRLQEVLADRAAIAAFGFEPFRTGLDHVIRRELLVGTVLPAEVESAQSENRNFRNVYDVLDEANPETDELTLLFDTAINRETTEQDSHPSPIDRYKHGSKINAVPAEPLEGYVWDCFDDKTAIREEYNPELLKEIRRAMVYA
ncbi:MAG: M48 family metalloprotease [Pyrinomonadaceae bacterium]